MRNPHRTFNWLVDVIEHDMYVKDQIVLRKLSVEDVGLKPTDIYAPVPQFFMISQNAQNRWKRIGTTRALNARSEAGRARSKELRKEQRRLQRQAAGAARDGHNIRQVPLLEFSGKGNDKCNGKEKCNSKDEEKARARARAISERHPRP